MGSMWVLVKNASQAPVSCVICAMAALMNAESNWVSAL